MTRAARVRELITSQGPQSIACLASALGEPHKLVKATVMDMRLKGMLVSWGDGRYGIGRDPCTVPAKGLPQSAWALRPQVDPLWRAWRTHPVPAINPAPLRWAA